MLAVFFYAPYLLGIATFPDGDFTHHFLPFSMFQRQALAALEAPLWNPYTYSGHPFWADIQAAVLYPVSNLLLLVTLPFADWAARLYFLQVEALIHLALAGYFVYLLVRDLTGRLSSGLVAGICFMLSGYLTGYPPLQLAVLRTGIWLPLLMWLLLRAWREPERWRYWIGAAAAFAVAFLGGHAQTWLLAAYATGGWLVALAIGPSASKMAKRRARLAGLAAWVLIGGGLAAAQALPSWEFARLSVRANVDYAYVSGGFPVQDLWNLVLPRVLTQFSPLYIGAVGLGLAVIGATAPVGSSESQTMSKGRVYFVALTLFGLLAGMGENGFLYPILYRVAPGWDMFRGQERAAYLTALGLSVLAGHGMSAVYRLSLAKRRRYALTYGAMVTAAVYAFGMLWQLPGRTAVNDWQYLAIAFGTLVSAMTLVVLLRLPGWSERRSVILCAVAAANLFIVNFTTNLDLVTPAAKAAVLPEVAALQEALAGGGQDKDGLSGRVYNEYRVYDDYGMRSSIEDVWGSSPLRLATYAQLFDQFPLDRMWRLTGVGYVLTWRKELFGPSELLAEFPQREDTTYLHRLPAPPPRAWLVMNIAVADDDTAWSMLADHGFDLSTNAVLPPASGVSEGPAGSGDGDVRLRRVAAGRISVDVATSDGGLVAVSENWMPGWHVRNATCDGAPCNAEGASPNGLAWLTPVRANLAFLAIAVPSGDVRFDLVYDPVSIRIGAIITGATGVALAFVLLWRSQRRRRSGSQ